MHFWLNVYTVGAWGAIFSCGKCERSCNSIVFYKVGVGPLVAPALLINYLWFSGNRQTRSSRFELIDALRFYGTYLFSSSSGRRFGCGPSGHCGHALHAYFGRLVAEGS